MGTLSSELRPIVTELSGAPRVYADANLPAALVAAMRHDLGWDVLFVLEDETLRRAPDREHYRRAREFGRTLITLDRDFADDRAFPSADSPGVIICTAPDETWLLRLLHYIDQTWLRGAATPPLVGRKIQLTTDMIMQGR